jgi:hypothetical protein
MDTVRGERITQRHETRVADEGGGGNSYWLNALA